MNIIFNIEVFEGHFIVPIVFKTVYSYCVWNL